MNATHANRLARLRGHAPPPLPAIHGFPQKPWELCGIRRFEWFQNPERAALAIHILFAQTLNAAADKDDLPLGVLNQIDDERGRTIVYPRTVDDPIILYRRPGMGKLLKNPAWISFLAWLDALDRSPTRKQIEGHKAQVRAVMAAHNAPNVVAFRPLPYGHRLGPSPTPKGGFGPVGGGNRSGAAKRNGRSGPASALVSYAELLHGFHTIDGKPFVIDDPEIARQDRAFDNEARNWRRIRTKGKKTPIGRPRMGGDKERLARQLLAAGLGVKNVARKLHTGVSFVQRVKKGTEIRPS